MGSGRHPPPEKNDEDGGNNRPRCPHQESVEAVTTPPPRGQRHGQFLVCAGPTAPRRGEAPTGDGRRRLRVWGRSLAPSQRATAWPSPGSDGAEGDASDGTSGVLAPAPLPGLFGHGPLAGVHNTKETRKPPPRTRECDTGGAPPKHDWPKHRPLRGPTNP